MTLLDKNDNSTEVKSDESLLTQKPILRNNKKLLVNNFLIINKKNINQAKIDTINKYYELANKYLIFNIFNKKSKY